MTDQNPIENSDDFTLADESDVYVPDEKESDDFRLAQTADGLSLAPPEEPEIYGVSGEAPASAPAAANATPPKPEASGNGEGEVYGLRSLLESAPELEKEIPDHSLSEAFRKAKTTRPIADATEDDVVSLDSIYDRKQRQMADEEEKPREERAPLPERPFQDRIFQPFKSIRFQIRYALAVALTFVPLLLATFFFSRALSHCVAEMLEKNNEIGAFFAFASCLWNDRVIFLLFTFAWGVFAIPPCLQIFVDTASGADEVEDWPDYSVVTGLGQFLWLASLALLAGIPGGILFRGIGLPGGVGFALVSAALTPVFFLSCMQADALFALVTKDVWRSFKRVPRSWLTFLGICYAFFFGTVFATLAAIRFVVAPGAGTSISFLRAASAAIILSMICNFVPALLLRYLGRLAWIIEDDARKRLAEEQSENVGKSDGQKDADEL